MFALGSKLLKTLSIGHFWSLNTSQITWEREDKCIMKKTHSCSLHFMRTHNPTVREWSLVELHLQEVFQKKLLQGVSSHCVDF